MKNYYAEDPEFYLIYMRDYQAARQEIKNAPKFREYIQEVVEANNICKLCGITFEEYEFLKWKEQKHEYYKNNRHKDKNKQYQREYQVVYQKLYREKKKKENGN